MKKRSVTHDTNRIPVPAQMINEQILTHVQDRVGLITLNRPDRLNAMSSQMESELHRQVEAWNDDGSVGAIVITGAGRAFCSGADIANFEAAVSGDAPKGGSALPGASRWIELVQRSKPVICAINGFAVGVGLTMTLPCDIRVAAEGARLSFRFVRIGLTPEFASTHYLPQLVGLGKAMELMLTGRFVEADEAASIGLVNHCFPADRMLERAMELGREIAANPTWHLLRTKRQIYDHYLERDLRGVVDDEGNIFREAQGTPEHKEALLAFREKREPSFHQRVSTGG